MAAPSRARRRMIDVLRIFGLWRGRVLWLTAGVIVSLAALGAGIGMMAVGGAILGVAVAAGTLVAPLALRGLGIARVVLRYAERLLTHAATFRALADLRVWFFRSLARSAAGGLGFRQAGDVLARLVGDIEALDGLYLRILVPLAGAVLLFPVLIVLLGMHDVTLALAIGYAVWRCGIRAAVDERSPGSARRGCTGQMLPGRYGSQHSMPSPDCARCERSVPKADMLAAVQAREATLLATQHELAGRAALANAGALLCGRAAFLAGPDRGRQQSGDCRRRRVPGGGGIRGSGRAVPPPGFSPALPRPPRIACWRLPRRRLRRRIRRIPSWYRSASRCGSKRSASAPAGRPAAGIRRADARSADRARALRCSDRRAPANPRSPHWH